jgi:hypothetical protein
MYLLTVSIDSLPTNFVNNFQTCIKYSFADLVTPSSCAEDLLFYHEYESIRYEFQLLYIPWISSQTESCTSRYNIFSRITFQQTWYCYSQNPKIVYTSSD